MSERKICTYCGQEGHRAHACPRRFEADAKAFSAGLAAVADDLMLMVVAEALNSYPGSKVVTLRGQADILDFARAIAPRLIEAERQKLLRKFDGYVPADQASSMRLRIMELEECLRVDGVERQKLLDRIRDLEAEADALRGWASSLQARQAGGDAEVRAARLQRALDHISTAATGNEIYPTGPDDIEFAEDGNTVVRYVGPWAFKAGRGETFLEAVEQDMRLDAPATSAASKLHGSRPEAIVIDDEDMAEHPPAGFAGGPPIDLQADTVKLPLFTSGEPATLNREAVEAKMASTVWPASRDEQVDQRAGFPVITDPLAIEAAFRSDDNGGQA